MFGAVLAGIFALAMVLSLPAVQKSIASVITSKLEAAKEQCHIEIGEITVLPFSSFIVRDVLIIDRNPYSEDEFATGLPPIDTVLYVKSASGTFSIAGLLRKEGIHLSRLAVDGAQLAVASELDRTRGSNIARIMENPMPPEVPVFKPSAFDVRKVRVKDFRFRLENFHKNTRHFRGIGINWTDIDAICSSLRAHNFRMTGGRAYFIVDQMELSEKSGYRATLRGRAKVGLGKGIVEKLHIRDAWSDLTVPELIINHGNLYNLRDYVNKVKMSIRVRKSVIASETLRYFADNDFNGRKFNLDVRAADAEGYVSDFVLGKLILSEKVSGITTDISGSIRGIGANRGGKPFYLVDLKSPATTFTLPSSGERFCFSGRIKGPDSRLDINGRLSSKIGGAAADLRILNVLDKEKSKVIRGKVSTEELQIGRIFGSDLIGASTIDAAAEVTAGNGFTDIRIDSLHASKLTLADHPYTGISALGNVLLKKGAFPDIRGALRIADPDIFLNAESSPEMIRIDVRDADLSALGINLRGENPKASATIEARNLNFADRNITGDISVNDLVLKNDDGIRNLGAIRLDSKAGRQYSVKLRSGFADIDFDGSKPVSGMLSSLRRRIIDDNLPSLSKGPAPADSADRYSLSARFHDSRGLLAFILPGAYIADSTSLDATISGADGLSASLTSGRLAVGTDNVRNLSVTLNSRNGRLDSDMHGEEIILKGARIGGAKINVTAESDSLSVRLGHERTEIIESRGELTVGTAFSRNSSDSLVVRGHIFPSDIHLDDTDWHFGESRFTYTDKTIDIDNFFLSDGASQRIRIDGGFSTNREEKMDISLEDLNLDIIRIFAGRDTGIGGTLNGKGLIVSPPGDTYRMEMDLTCDSLSTGGEKVGNLYAGTRWNKDRNSLDVTVSNECHGRKALTLNGSFFQSDKSMDITAEMDRFNVAVVRPLLKNVFSNIGGFVSGKITAGGPLKKPCLRSENLRLDSTRVRILATGVPYTICGPLRIDSTSLVIDGLTISDTLNGHGHLNGNVLMSRADGIRLDSKLKVDDIQVLNLGENAGSKVYGQLFANGDLHVSGSPDDLNIEGSVGTAGPGKVHIPLGGSVNSSRSNLLTFAEDSTHLRIDPYDEMLGNISTKKKRKGNINIGLNARFTPETELVIEIDKASGNMLSTRGEANLGIQAGTSVEPSVTGDYILSGGKYNFSIPGIVQKEFNIQDGSALMFGGKIQDTRLGITAIYNLKTSISTLLSDTTTVSTRRPVECIINISDYLKDPTLDFDINVSDLDPTTKAKVDAVLNTEGKVQRQFIALLVMGIFLPNEQSGVVNSTNILYSNVSQVMAGQINNIFQKLDIPLDLGLGYQQSNTGPDIFDVAVSTQLFNNRVVVNGSVGNRKYSTSAAPGGDVVGDIDVEVKLDKPGKFRLKLFSHSADQFTSFLDHSQRNGAGISYQKEFDTYKELWQSLFKPKGSAKTDTYEQQAVSDTVSVGR